MRFVPFVALVLAAACGPAFAQPARPPAPVVDPAFEAAQRAFDSLPEAERKAIQDDLIWASDFTATVSGSYGRRTHDALLAFKRRLKLRPDALLDDTERKLLAETAAKSRAAAKVSRHADARTGAAYLLPGALLSRRELLPGGTRHSSTDGTVILETTLATGGADDLPAAFERVISAPVAGRKVTYKLLRPDFFVVAGETGPRSFYTRYGLGEGKLSGYTLSYPTARARDIERTVIALANSFEPVAQARPVTPATGSNLAAVTTPPPAPNSLAPGLILTGVVTAPGRIVTAALAAQCPALVVNGKPARLTGSTGGLATLEADTGTAPALALAATAAQAGPVLTLGFVGEGRPVLTVGNGEIIMAGSTARLTAPLHREAGGTLVLSRGGGWVGLAAAPRLAPRLVAGLVPALSHALIAAPAGHAGTAAGGAVTSGTLVAGAGQSLVPVSCRQPTPLPQ